VLTPLAQVQLEGVQLSRSGTPFKADVVVPVPLRVSVAVSVSVPPRSVKVTIDGTVADALEIPVAVAASVVGPVEYAVPLPSTVVVEYALCVPVTVPVAFVD
jgi:hypothetical protein